MKKLWHWIKVALFGRYAPFNLLKYSLLYLIQLCGGDLKRYNLWVYQLDGSDWYQIYDQDTRRIREMLFVRGAYHSLDGPAWIERKELGGPALEKKWYLHGKLHREDGPAVIRHTGDEWWLEGYPLTEENFNKLRPMSRINRLCYLIQQWNCRDLIEELEKLSPHVAKNARASIFLL